jgi:hypothetical protein
MRALFGTLALCATLLGTIRPAQAHVALPMLLPMPRLALSMALDWNKMFAERSHRTATAPSPRAASARQPPRLTVTTIVPAPSPSPTVAAYDRLTWKLMRWVQPRKDFAPEQQPRVHMRALSASPMLPARGFGAWVTVETDALSH